MNERLSAFLDGEANGDDIDAVLSHLMNDEPARDSWSRQNWIRTTLRASDTEKPVALDLGFAGRVMQAIEAEDRDARTTAPLARERTTAAMSSRPRRRLGSRAWQGMAGMGMAAAVAGVVFISSSPFSQGGGRASSVGTVASSSSSSQRNTRMQDVAASESSGFASAQWNNQLVDFGTVRAAQASSTNVRTVAAESSSEASDRWSVSDPAVREELNGYLADHNGMARGYGMSSTTPAYVRVATYGQGATQ